MVKNSNNLSSVGKMVFSSKIPLVERNTNTKSARALKVSCPSADTLDTARSAHSKNSRRTASLSKSP